MIRSPLRYPGGKTALANHIIDRFIGAPDILVSPFFGGGSIELTLAERGTKVRAYDADAFLINFWDQLLTKGFYSFFSHIADEDYQFGAFPWCNEYFNEFEYYKELLFDSPYCDREDAAALFFLINRASFSGLGKNGGFSREAADRVNVKSLGALRDMDPYQRIQQNIYVEWQPWQQSINNYTTGLIYADPPYVGKERLYGLKSFDHEGLAERLHKRNNWVLSYGDCPQVRELYAGYPMYEISANYCGHLGANKLGHELIITSKDRQPLGLF